MTRQQDVGSIKGANRMHRVQRVQFLKGNRLLVQAQDEWCIYRWPKPVILAEGRGTVVVVAGNAVGELTSERGFTLGGEPVSVRLPDDEPVREYAYWPERGVLVVAGRSALTPSVQPGPSLLPVPSQGPTAQRFGSYPEQGPSLWVWEAEIGEPRLLLRASGIEEISRPRYLDAERAVYRRFGYAVYGRTAQSRLWLVHVSTGASQDLLPDLPGATTGFALGEHGYAFMHSQGSDAFPFWYRLAVRLKEGGIHYPLPEELRLTAEPPAWSLDGRWLVVTAFYGIQVGVIRVRLPESEAGSWWWEWMGEHEGSYRSPAVHDDGSVAAVRETPGQAEVVVLDGQQPPRVWALAKVPSAALAQPVDYQLVRWTNRESGLEGIYCRPRASTATVLPLVVDLHGGPINGLCYQVQPRLEAWCRRGFAAFAPDYRASGILGREEMMRTLRGDEGAIADECEDVLTGVDHLIARGMADGQRVLLFGHSAGATLVNHLLAHSRRFRAAVSWEGHADAVLGFYVKWGGGGLAFARRLYGGSPLQVPAVYRRQSAITQAARITTPVLLVYGDDQPADAIQWYTVLRETGVETELILYRGEGHILRRPENLEDLFDRAVDWFGRWLVIDKGGDGTSAPPVG